jgi:hypothetical protein
VGTDVLRAAVRALRQPQALHRAPAPTSSVFGRAAAAVPADVGRPTTRAALQARFRTVETSALLAGTTMVLVVLPDPGPAPAEVLATADIVVRGGGRVVLLGPSMPRRVDTQPVTVPLRTDDDLAREWALLACGPGRRVAFLARRQGDELWSSVLTRDSVAVQRAGTAILERVPFLRLRVPPLDPRPPCVITPVGPDAPLG